MSKSSDNLEQQFVLCLRNEGYEASLELLKLYRVLPDPKAAEKGLLRVMDESDEDYLYPESFFVVMPLSGEVRESVIKALHAVA